MNGFHTNYTQTIYGTNQNYPINYSPGVPTTFPSTQTITQNCPEGYPPGFPTQTYYGTTQYAKNPEGYPPGYHNNLYPQGYHPPQLRTYTTNVPHNIGYFSIVTTITYHKNEEKENTCTVM